jgi:1-acyl-sn-glycerol-3-phosphate acyltransferase
MAFRLVALLVRPLVRAMFRVRITGRELVPADGPFVIAANHLGWLDSFLVLLAFPLEPRVHFLGAARGLVARPLQWRMVRLVGGYIPVDMDRHGDRRLHQHVERCLELGGAVAFYPEACYGRPGELQPFRKGFAHFATRASVPVVPVAISGTDRLWLRREVRLEIGAPVQGTDVDDVLQRSLEAMQSMVECPARPIPRLRPLETALTNLL